MKIYFTFLAPCPTSALSYLCIYQSIYLPGERKRRLLFLPLTPAIPREHSFAP